MTILGGWIDTADLTPMNIAGVLVPGLPPDWRSLFRDRLKSFNPFIVAAWMRSKRVGGQQKDTMIFVGSRSRLLLLPSPQRRALSLAMR